MIGGRARYFIFSLIPLLALSAVVFYYTNKRVSIVNLSRPQPITVPVSSLPPDKYLEKQQSFSLEIKGSEEFKEQIKQALKIIWNSDKNDFYFIRKYVFEIREENKTDFYFDGEKPVIGISKSMSSQSLTWTAGIIAHNAVHAYGSILKKMSKKKKEVSLPGENKVDRSFVNPVLFDGKTFSEFLEVEKKASSYQMEVLRKIKAPRFEIDKIKNREEKDFSIAHDGDYFVSH